MDDTITLLRERLENGVEFLTEMKETYGISALEELRLAGKLEGVKLALSYLDEEMRMK